MVSKNVFPILLLIACMLLGGCSNDVPASDASQQQAPDTTSISTSPATPSSDTTALATDASGNTSSSVTPSSTGPLPRPAIQPGQQPIDTTGNAAARRPSQNEVRSAARPSDKVVKHDSPFKSNTTAAIKKQNPAGNPTGFIGRENIGFYTEPSTSSKKISTLKIYESVIILETKMTDEAGKSYDMPQWYKVQLTNKQIGWIIGSSLTLN